MTVRAKFRCLSVKHTYEHHQIVKLAPVNQRAAVRNEENKLFWTATPNGELRLGFNGPAVDDEGKPFSPGFYYYIDLDRDDASQSDHLAVNEVTTRGWGDEVKLNYVTRRSRGEPGLMWGDMRIGLSETAANVIALLGPSAKAKHKLRVSFAETSDDSA